MREVIDLRRLQTLPADEAAALLIARNGDPTGDEDRAVLETWLASAEENRNAWSRMTRILRTFDAPDDGGLLDDLREAARSAGPRFAALPRYRVGAAASFAILFASIVMFGGWSLFQEHDRPQIAQGVQTGNAPRGPTQLLSTATGEIRAVALSDGTKITLDTGSAVEVAFSDARRDLRLVKGRAQFNVKHDASRPLSVRAAGFDVVAIGTRFDVKLTDSGISVVLLQGRVKVANVEGESEAFVLNAGQELILNEGSAPKLLQISQDQADTWAGGMLTFRDQPLSEVVKELNRYSSDRLIIRDARVGALRLTGTLRPGDMARFARTLSAVHPVRIVRVGRNQWEIKFSR